MKQLTEPELMARPTMAEIQRLVKAPKSQFNSFGKYKYRSAEDIMEAVKPVINPMGYWLIVSDEVVAIGSRIYVKATAVLTDGNNLYKAEAYARESDEKKGMDAAQITGACASYSRKYALQGLFCLDDNSDPDATNKHDDYSDFKNELNNCKTISELVEFYNQNKTTVDNSTELKKLFATRKSQIA